MLLLFFYLFFRLLLICWTFVFRFLFVCLFFYCFAPLFSPCCCKVYCNVMLNDVKWINYKEKNTSGSENGAPKQDMKRLSQRKNREYVYCIVHSWSFPQSFLCHYFVGFLHSFWIFFGTTTLMSVCCLQCFLYVLAKVLLMYIFQNPDGSLQRAAMTQSALAKERRELKQAQREAQADSIPKDLGKLWVDPVPDCKNLFLLIVCCYCCCFCE